jgi:type I restriction enzyme, S subunit
VSTGKTEKNIALPTGWDIRPLGEVVQPTRPRIKPSEKPNLPFIGMENIEAHTMKLLGTVPAGTMKSSAVHFQPDDVLYGRLRPYLNKVYRPDFEGLCSAEFIVFPKTESISSRYLQYFLNSSSFVSYASHLNAGDRPRVDFEQLSPYPFPYAPYEQQQRIVEAIEKQFSRLDESVALLKRVKANLKRYKAAVLKAAVEGKLTEEWRKQHPDVEPASKLLERILVERRAKWGGRGKYIEPEPVDTAGLPPLPKGWTWARLEQLGIIFGGLTKNPKRAKFTKKLPYLRVANVYANELRLDEIEHIGVQDSELEKLLLRRGDLLVVEGNGSKDQIGRLAVWDGSINPCVHQNHLIKARLIIASMNKWILFWLLSPIGRNFIEKVSSSTSGLYTLSVNKVGDLPIIVPSAAEQDQIIAEVERQLSVIEELDATVEPNLTRADRLRQSILSQAFSNGQSMKRSPDNGLTKGVSHNY